MTHTHCRCCGSDKMTPYLDLGYMPLANQLSNTEHEAKYSKRYPLKVLFCNGCSLSQLSEVIDPELMFSNYVYRSGISAKYVQHCNDMAVTMKDRYGLNADSFVIDIAGNDGTLLREFKKVIGCKVLNVDPAKNMEKYNEDLRFYSVFWGTAAAKHLMITWWPKANLITATNVFAHVNDVKDFLLAALDTLADTGVLVLEFPYLIDFIEKKEFDTVYFEHLSYFSITPLMWLVTDCGMKILSVEKQDIHGGSVRVTIAKQWAELPVTQSVDEYVTNEEKDGWNKIDRYNKYQADVAQTLAAFEHGIERLVGRVAAFAASAKGNTLLNLVSHDRIDYIVDETPEKIGKYTPGCGKLVITIEQMMREPPDYLIILSWNFATSIMEKCISAGYKGKFVLPIPEWKVI